MLPIPIPYRIALIAVAAFLVAIGAFTYGYSTAKDKYLGELNVLKGIVQQADTQAKETIKKQEVISNEVDQTHSAHIQALAKFYKDSNSADLANARARYRMLSGQNPAPASAVASSEQKNDGRTQEQTVSGCNLSEQETITGCPKAVEEACASDAELVLTWQDWARRQNIPVE